jgi:hypothetical protein
MKEFAGTANICLYAKMRDAQTNGNHGQLSIG